jgi:Uncharacterized protein conserved in bacteria (DUF2066)
MRHLLCFFLIALLPLIAHAETVDITVTAKATKQSAEEAKAQVLNDSQRTAFYMALEKTAPKQARDLYRKLRGSPLSRFIASFTIGREVQKAGYYEADVTYRFDRSALMGLVGEDQGLNADAGVPTGNGLLIIPPYDPGEKLVLFEPQNLWRAILNKVALEVGQGTLVMPFGDEKDIAILSDETVLSGDPKTLAALARRYGTRNVVIAFARSRVTEKGLLVEVVLRKAGGKKQDEIIKRYKAYSQDDTLDKVLGRAALATSLRLRKSLEEYSLFGTPEDRKLKGLVIRAEYQFGHQWRQIQKMLEAAPGLHHLEVGAVGTTFAQATLFYRGSKSDIQQMLLARNLKVDTSKEYWVVRLP